MNSIVLSALVVLIPLYSLHVFGAVNQSRSDSFSKPRFHVTLGFFGSESRDMRNAECLFRNAEANIIAQPHVISCQYISQGR